MSALPTRVELAGLSRLAGEFTRFASWTADVSRGRTGEPNLPAVTNLEPDAPLLVSSDAEPVAQASTVGEQAAESEPLRSGVFGRRFKRR